MKEDKISSRDIRRIARKDITLQHFEEGARGKSRGFLAMQKNSLLFFFLTLFSLNFASAYGYYPASISDALYRIEPTTIVLSLLFIILFAFLNWILARYFKDNKATAGIIAFAVSLLAIYGIWRKGFDIENIFGDIGVGADLFYTLLPLIVIAVIIGLIIKFGRNALGILGLLLIAVSIFAVEGQAILILIGGALIILWFFFRKKKDNVNFPQNSSSSNPSQPKPSGYPTLKSEAKTFRNWADRQSNPQMFRNWAQFISYMKNRGYGKNEKEIMNNLNVTQREISDVVKSYIN